ncbi:pentapeptide repeat-containing protein [Candidatus Methylobacter oryzae]|uniref:Pentapeptide repeat-containing protein n=1 Tax=Candidatus Methylobacter oryzae TaxID=2497749 RepID=A0ABY3C552_9GAMM|nr:pentapeptide repeat-containing protein [Candidatus Methylobacter oryzae]TRW89956.1 pentapeptide repeat-containing protein [Candidatus Methylobacter oryzae]
MSNSLPQSNEELSTHIEKLLESANSASQTVAALHVAFMAFVTYLGVIIWGTTHEDLLRISPVKLPILDVELPLTTFYSFVPWMVVLLHFNLLMQLELLSCKLWNLDHDLPDTPAGQQVRNRLFIFPFTHLIVGRSEVWLIRQLLSLVVGITVIALPLLVLLAAQIRFLPFHDEAITWSERLAVWGDAVMLITLWPLIASPQDRAWEWWRSFKFHLLGYWPAWLRYLSALGWSWLTRLIQRIRPNLSNAEVVSRPVLQSRAEPKGMIFLMISVPLIVLLSIVAVIPGSITVQAYYAAEQGAPEHTSGHFEDWLIRRVPETWLSVAAYKYDVVSCTSLTMAEKADASILQVMLGPCSWFNLGLFPRNLNLREARLVPKGVSLSLLTQAIDPDKQVRDAAFKEFDGLNLQNRDLRFANFFGAVLPKADLRHVQLQGAILLKAKLQGVIGWDKTQLQGAILGGTQLQSATLTEANLQGADLRGANLQGADLSWTKLQSADLRGANLQGADLNGANLQGADLRGVKMQGAYLRDASFQGANLVYAHLQGSDLALAGLQAAELRKAELLGVDWSQANLDGIFIAESLAPEWNEQQYRKLEAMLKPILDSEKFSAFQTRIGSVGANLLLGKPISQTSCYSDNPTLLACEYRNLLQLDSYRTEVLHPKLIELACSDEAVAPGIARRGINKSVGGDPDFGLAAALLKALDAPNPCPGLSALFEQTRQKLREAAAQQK